MNLYLEKLSSDEWNTMSELSHKISFDLDRPNSMNRVDYALLVRNDREPCCYATVIELDAKHAFLQHGGSFPSINKGVYPVRGYFMFVNWLKEHYSIISFTVINKNVAMIKLALAAGLNIIGMSLDNNDLFINFEWKRTSAKV